MNLFLKVTEINEGQSFGSSSSINRLLIPKPLIQLVKELPEGSEIKIGGGIGTIKVKESFDIILEELCAM